MTNEERLKVFADNLKFYMSQYGYTQKDIAEKLGVTQQAVNIWSNGKGSPRLDKAQMLAQLLNIKMTDLTEERKPKESLQDVFDRRPDLQEVLEILSNCSKEQVKVITEVIKVLNNKLTL